MTNVLDDEQRLIRARVSLTQQIDRGSVVLSARLAEAFLNIPRHPFVPVFYRREGERFVPWRTTDGDGEAWLDAVYTDDSLLTEVDGVHAERADPAGVTGVPTSSSTAPSLMADMLDALDVNEGDEVYEAGAGSGYNAAMLCHLAGDKHVTTVDRSETLTALARERLNALGFDPLVLHGDGARDVPSGVTYDRIIATASVRRVPPLWLERCRTGGIMVVPVKDTLAGGMIARLTKLPDGTAVGRVLHTPAAFMPLKSGDEGGAQVPEIRDRPSRDAELSGQVLDDWTFSFFAQLHMPHGLIRTYGRSDGGLHVTTLYDPADDSATRVEDMPEGTSLVTCAGPRDLWAPMEAAHRLWRRLNRPRREWFNIDVTPAEQTVTYTPPNGQIHRWTL
ncbi:MULTISPECIES: methyltransferase domain-containing protein [Streptomyces]|uniref:methyltransferase domain-containing protein n=1 Tax=Streptomyces TaxID=1883 RepID=UPI0020C06E58|nr:MULTISPECIES: methyltransferase domain-containing protein [Streptomyces]MCL6297552.1 protein-L-isoaspartate(D-aspartate) O-methyltransferase [Streptomyces kronopolitis]GLW16339.1 protein-L-isoaspartate O-methyltransferase [Streptomyces sp. NBRC 13847]